MLRSIPFNKLSGCGNDFIIIDNRNNIVDTTNVDLISFIKTICHRRLSLGADGLILVEQSKVADFKWRFFNNDGSEADMCGNGARCVARFAFEHQIATTEMSFETKTGVIYAQVSGKRVKVSMPDPQYIIHNISMDVRGSHLSVNKIHTGVPHAVIYVEDASQVNVVEIGREIRYHPIFAPDGVNVNFISRNDSGCIFNRTYERGVEDETLACGTGCIAGAIFMASRYGVPSPVTIKTKGGEFLTIYFKETHGNFHQVYLEGDTRLICRGELTEESWK